jgi:hypothetical protein
VYTRRVERYGSDLSPTLYINFPFLTNRAMNDWDFGFIYTDHRKSICAD